MKEMTKPLTVFRVSLYGHKSQQLSEYHPREVISVLSLHFKQSVGFFFPTHILFSFSKYLFQIDC